MEKDKSKDGLLANRELDKETPLISAVTCFLNVGQFLEESINSVLAQNYPNWELILVDDGSSDNSGEIAKKFSDQYPNIHLYQHEGHVNKGLSASRNLAISKASGEMLAFLDGDDIWTPDFLSNAFLIKKQQQVPFYCERTKYWHTWKFPERFDTDNPVGTTENKIYSPPELMSVLYPLGIGSSPTICSLLVDKKILEKHGGFDNAFKGMYEDQVFLSKIYLNEKVYISSSCNNIYRQRGDSLVYTARSEGTYLKSREFFLDWLERYMKRSGVKDKMLNGLLRKALFPFRYPKLYYLVELLPKKIDRKMKRLFKKFNSF